MSRSWLAPRMAATQPHQVSDSATFQLSRIYSNRARERNIQISGKGNQCMRRTDILRHLLWSIGLIVLLIGCSSLPAQSTQISSSPTVQSIQVSPSQHVRQLKPDAPIPASCPATPVNVG